MGSASGPRAVVSLVTSTDAPAARMKPISERA